MNKIWGKVEEFHVHGGLTEVILLLEGNIRLISLVIETPDTSSYLEVGKRISAVFKETEVILAKGSFTGLSMTNRFQAKVQGLEPGRLLSRVSLESKAGTLSAILSKRDVDSMKLKSGDEVTVLLKSNEVMIGS